MPRQDLATAGRRLGLDTSWKPVVFTSMNLVQNNENNMRNLDAATRWVTNTVFTTSTASTTRILRLWSCCGL